MTFHYQPLGVGEIRVLRIHAPSSFSSPLECEVQHISLADDVPSHPYEALSYCWVPSKDRRTILLNGLRFSAPMNTELALRRMMSGHDTRTLWVDAICINQNDVEERQQQVALMGKVYSLCQRTLVYLGEEDELTARAVSNITSIHEEVRERSAAAGSFDALVKREEDARTIFFASTTAYRTPCDDDALAQFFSRPWFSRVWVVQEVILPPEALYHCGDSVGEFSALTEVALWLSYFHSEFISDQLATCDGLMNAARMWEFGSQYSESRTIQLKAALERLRGSEATDARDRVFGILGIYTPRDFDEDIRALLAPDYTKTVEEVFRDAVRYTIMTGSYQELYLLRYVSHRSEAELRSDRLPSWVPRLNRDWDVLEGDAPVITDHSSSDQGIPKIKAIDRRNDDILTLLGSTLGTVSEALQALDRFNVGYLNQYMSTARDLALRLNITTQRLARTMIVDTDHLSKKSAEKDWRGLQDLAQFWQRHADCGLLHNLKSDAPESQRRACEFWTAIQRNARNKRICSTDTGFLGQCPKITRPGDIVILVLQGDTPYVIRPHEDHYLFIGQCYIDGAMLWQDEYKELVQEFRSRKSHEVFRIS